MPYVYRDAEGAIAAVYEQPVEGGEEVAVDDSALIAFIQKNVPVAVTDEWVQSDLALARVMEDLIEILIDKKVMMFTDFPEGAQKKLLERRGFRKEFSYVEGLFGDDEFGGDDSDNSGSGGLF
tara:strand:+ start:61235 stop:61603 length:369 start_codon:yes stop_codon:yes gene_type:complete